MAKPLKRFVCQSCGAVTSKWVGRCESCGEWNTSVEEAAPAPGPAGGGLARGGKGRTLEFAGLRGSTPQPERYRSGISEFDRVTFIRFVTDHLPAGLVGLLALSLRECQRC